MRKIGLFVFDLDGTLVDSRADIVKATNLALEEMGYKPIDFDTIVYYVGEGVQRLMERSMMKSSGDKNPLEPKRIRKAVKIMRRYYSDCFLETTKTYPHVEEILEYYSNAKKAVVSNKPERFTVKILEGLNIRQHFEVVYGGDSLANKKPHPEPLMKAMQICSTTPEQSLMIGDSAVDIETGKVAGMLTCGVTYGLRDRKEIADAGADVIIDDLLEMKKYFQSNP